MWPFVKQNAMKHYLRTPGICAVFLFISLHLFGQGERLGFDSMKISKPKTSKFLYKFNDPVLSSITIKSSSPKRSKVSSGEVLGSVGRSAAALFSGISFSSTKEVFWNLKGKLVSNNENLSWEVNLYCPGILEKNKERVKNEDGGYSVETDKVAHLNWHEEATGIILENGDTIAKFIIIMDPRTNPLVSKWNEAPYRQRHARYNPPPQKNRWYMPSFSYLSVDYAIVGRLRGEGFVLLNNGELWQSWLFDQDRLKMIFDADIDDYPKIEKKDRLVPSMKCNLPFTIMEKFDMIRMAMMSRYLSTTLSRSTY